MEENQFIDLNVVIKKVLNKWSLLVLFVVAGAVAGGLVAYVGGRADEEDSRAQQEQYEADKEYYDTMKSLYDQWIKEGEDTLREYTWEDSSEETSRLDQTQKALEILETLPKLKANRDVLIEPVAPRTGEGVFFKVVTKAVIMGACAAFIVGIMLIFGYYVIKKP